MDRIASDNPALETRRATVARHGGTRRRIELPDDVPTGEVVRLVLDGTTYHARIEDGFADTDPYLAGAYDTPGDARSGEGSNRLQDWLDAVDRSPGSTVLLDVIESEFAYGLRAPGEEAVYDAVEKPRDSLASIARDLEDGE